MKQVLGFIGIKDVNVVLAGGTAAIDMGKAQMQDVVGHYTSDVSTAAKAA